MIINNCFKVRRFVLAAVLSIGTSFISSAFAESYFLVDTNNKVLTPLKYSGEIALGTGPRNINELGQVVGTSKLASGSIHAFLTGPNGVGVTDVGILPEETYVVNSAAVNDSGQVVITAYLGNTGESRGFITGPNGADMIALNALYGDEIYAADINNVGQVTGFSETEIGHNHAFITGPNGVGMTDIAMLNGWQDYYSGGEAINNSGQVAGWSFDGEDVVFITGPNGVGMTRLNVLPVATYNAIGSINDAGQVAGSFVQYSKGWEAFITGPHGTDAMGLGTLGGDQSYAMDLNDSGQVVGWSGIVTDQVHAFITGPNGEDMIDLNSLVDLPDGFVLNGAIAINNQGQVLAYANSPFPIPEPEIYALMLAGLGLIGFMARRKKSEDRV